MLKEIHTRMHVSAAHPQPLDLTLLEALIDEHQLPGPNEAPSQVGPSIHAESQFRDNKELKACKMIQMGSGTELHLKI